jgi:hypothetical protein
MSTRTFCDGCGEELGFRNGRFDVDNEKGGVCFRFQSVGFNQLVGGDVCKYCLIDAVNVFDDRPRQVR